MGVIVIVFFMSKVVVSVCCTLDNNATQILKKKEFNHAAICPFWCMSILSFSIVALLQCSIWFVTFNTTAWTILGKNCERILGVQWYSKIVAEYGCSADVLNIFSATLHSIIHYLIGREPKLSFMLNFGKRDPTKLFFLWRSLFIIVIFYPHLPWEKSGRAFASIICSWLNEITTHSELVETWLSMWSFFSTWANNASCIALILVRTWLSSSHPKLQHEEIWTFFLWWFYTNYHLYLFQSLLTGSSFPLQLLAF